MWQKDLLERLEKWLSASNHMLPEDPAQFPAPISCQAAPNCLSPKDVISCGIYSHAYRYMKIKVIKINL